MRIISEKEDNNISVYRQNCMTMLHESNRNKSK